MFCVTLQSHLFQGFILQEGSLTTEDGVVQLILNGCGLWITCATPLFPCSLRTGMSCKKRRLGGKRPLVSKEYIDITIIIFRYTDTHKITWPTDKLVITRCNTKPKTQFLFPRLPPSHTVEHALRQGGVQIGKLV